MQANWNEISPPHDNEKNGLAYVKDNLPDCSPYMAWTNFEMADAHFGFMELDLFLVTPKGLYHIELKNYNATISGNDTTWILRRDGQKKTHPNPIPLAHRKSKVLSSRLRREIEKHTRDGLSTIFVKTLIYLTHPNSKVSLPADQLPFVVDREQLIEEVSELGRKKPWVDMRLAKQIRSAMESMGFKGPDPLRFPHYRLEKLLDDEGTWQDWLAYHTDLNLFRRLRLYPKKAQLGLNEEALESAVRREFQNLDKIDHPGILTPRDMSRCNLGPALVYDYHPDEQRLDHYLDSHELDDELRLHLLRRIAEAVQYAHGQNLIHRHLSPRAVIVRQQDGELPRVKVINWHAASRNLATVHQSTVLGTQLYDAPDKELEHVYQAPEMESGTGSRQGVVDSFSLGAITWTLFTGTPPASNRAELHQRLAKGPGLMLTTSNLPPIQALDDLVRTCTDPRPEMRGHVSEFLLGLDLLEDELTRPANQVSQDPTEARKGEIFEGGYKVVKRLGQGATSVVFLVDPPGGGERLVLKLAADPDKHNTHLEAEAETLERLRHEHIVAYKGRFVQGIHQVLMMSHARAGTVGAYLEERLVMERELLQRLGEQLLGVLAYLEDQDVAHRDIKPENLGLDHAGKDGQLKLQLFDFSLIRTPHTDTNVGTRAYRDPYLGNPDRQIWTPEADRYSAAVTLYRMATGALPRCRGGAEPGTMNEDPVIAIPGSEGNDNQALTAFFAKALCRKLNQRHGSIEEMREAWRTSFTAEKPTRKRKARPRLKAPTPANITPDSHPRELNLEPGLVRWLEQRGIEHVQQLIELDPKEADFRGLSLQQRRQLIPTIAIQTRRFGKEPSPAQQQAPDRHLLPAGLSAEETQILRRYLALDGDPNLFEEPLDVQWPGIGNLARDQGKTREWLVALLEKSRPHWRKVLADTREALVEELARLHGLASDQELAQALYDHASAVGEPLENLREAHATLRAICDMESGGANPRWQEKRYRHLVLISDEGGLGPARTAYLARLIAAAESLAEEEHLAEPARVRTIIGKVESERATPLKVDRALRLATGLSEKASLGDSGEIYPRGMAAARALHHTLPLLGGLQRFTEQNLREMVAGRYPEAEALPEKELGKWALANGLDAHYEPKEQAFTAAITTRSQADSSHVRSGAYSGVNRARDHVRDFEERLQRDLEKRDAHVYYGSKDQYLMSIERLRRLELTALDGDRLVIEELRAQAQADDLPWDLVLEVEANPHHPERDNLETYLLKPLRARLQQRLAEQQGVILLYHLGLWPRLDLAEVLDHTAANLGKAGPDALWLIVPQQQGDHGDHTPLLNQLHGFGARHLPPSWPQREYR